MIDTDKYEGHTPAPWVIEEGDMEYGETDTIITVVPPMNFVVANGIMRQDAQLIADAPLLLEEVKRLREQQQKILRIAETNMALEWGDTDASFEWGYIVDMIKGWTE